jgi:hypothetical protein
MSTAAHAPGVFAPKPEARTKASALGPDEQERIIAARGMVLLIVPLYVLILLALKADVPYRLARIGQILELKLDGLLPYLRHGYHALVRLACAAPALYALYGLVRLVRGGGSRRKIAAAIACVAVGIAEGLGIAAAVYYFKVVL